MKRLTVILSVSLLAACAIAVAKQKSASDESGRILGLENAWNHALQDKDTKALEMLLGEHLVSVDIDGSIQNKGEFLASIKDPSYRPQSVTTEETRVDMYGDAAVVSGVFKVKGVEKGKPFQHRERFVDTWVKVNNTWQCVATTSALITAKSTAD